MKILKNISACRLSVLLVICVFVKSPILYVLSCLILLLYNYKETLIFTILLLITICSNSLSLDLINIGIVERKQNNYYVIDKIIYKTISYDDNLEIGDIIITKLYKRSDDISLNKKNVKYIDNSTRKIGKICIKNELHKKIENYSDIVKDGLNKFIYNTNNYSDLSFNLGYGLAVYYLFKYLSKKFKKPTVFLIIVYSTVFYFDIKFYLIILDIILCRFNINKSKTFKIIIILLVMNKCLLMNYSILIPLLLNLHRDLNITLGLKTFFAFIQSILFGYINVILIFLYKITVYIQIFIFILSIMTMIFPIFSAFYECVLKFYSIYNNFSLEIRGQYTIIGILIYLLLVNVLKINSHLIQYILMILVLITPINSPFFSVNFIDVGQGDAILIHDYFNFSNVLIDTGSSYNYYKLKKYLYSKGIYKIDYLVITHNDSDHNGNISNILNDFKVENIVDKNIDINSGNIKLHNICLGKYDNDNDSSLVYTLEINNIKFLFTGDISSKAETKMINMKEYNDIDILKVSHHGSNTATCEYFVGNILPKYAIISTSGQYGHPSQTTIDILKSFNVKIYNTKESGNVEFYFLKMINLLKTNNYEFDIIKT